jgi:hypothetical protein
MRRRLITCRTVFSFFFLSPSPPSSYRPHKPLTRRQLFLRQWRCDNILLFPPSPATDDRHNYRAVLGTLTIWSTRFFLGGVDSRLALDAMGSDSVAWIRPGKFATPFPRLRSDSLQDRRGTSRGTSRSF